MHSYAAIIYYYGVILMVALLLGEYIKILKEKQIFCIKKMKVTLTAYC